MQAPGEQVHFPLQLQESVLSPHAHPDLSLFGQLAHLHWPGGHLHVSPQVQESVLSSAHAQLFPLPLLGQLAHLQSPGAHEQEPPQVQLAASPEHSHPLVLLLFGQLSHSHLPGWHLHGLSQLQAPVEVEADAAGVEADLDDSPVLLGQLAHVQVDPQAQEPFEAQLQEEGVEVVAGAGVVSFLQQDMVGTKLVSIVECLVNRVVDSAGR